MMIFQMLIRTKTPHLGILKLMDCGNMQMVNIQTKAKMLKMFVYALQKPTEFPITDITNPIRQLWVRTVWSEFRAEFERNMLGSEDIHMDGRTNSP